MMEINLEIPDQNIDTEGKRTSVTEKTDDLVSFVTLFYYELFTVLCV